MQPVLTLIEYPGYVEDQDRALSTLSYIPPVNMLDLNSFSECFLETGTRRNPCAA
jgi:hypothetical protein